MARAAREQACGESWDDVFGKVYDGYRTVIDRSTPPKNIPTRKRFR
jgi:hypothetical protein